MKRIALLLIAGCVAGCVAGCAGHWPWMRAAVDGPDAGTTGRFPVTLEAVAAVTPAIPELDIQTWRTAEGARVLFVASPTLPMVDVRLVFAAGSARDDKPGTAWLTSALLGEGAGELDVDDIARGFEDQGAQFGTSSYRDMGVVELRSLSDPERLGPAIALLARVIGEPTFPAAALDRVRDQTLVRLTRERQVPGPRASKAFDRTLFRGHPYGHPSTGTTATLPTITRDDLRAFHRTWYTAGNAVIALVGDLSRPQAEEIAATLSAALPAGPAAPALTRAEPLPERQVVHLDFPSSQTVLLLGNQAIWRGHPDWVPLYVGNHILGGGGFGSILTRVVREERGYVYGIGSGFAAMAAGGPFTVQLQTASENADEALAVTLELIRDFVRDGPSERQLQDARDDLLGSLAMSAAENDEIVAHLGMIGFYDLPLDYLQRISREVAAVTREQVAEAFRRHVDVDRLAIVSVGPVAPAIPGNDTADADAPAAGDE